MDWRIRVLSAWTQVVLSVLLFRVSADLVTIATDAAVDVVSQQASQCGVSKCRAIETELGAALGQSFLEFVDRRLGECRLRLRPLYDTLPKDVHNNLGYAASRYALQRYFGQRYAMRMLGLEALADVSANLAFVQQLAPSQSEQEKTSNVLDAWRKHLHQCGFTLDDLALFAATLEYAIDREVTATLLEAFKTHGVHPTSEDWTYGQLEQVIDHFTILRYTDGDPNSSAQPQRQILVGHRSVSHWADVQNFVRDVIDHTIDGSDAHGARTALELARIVAEELTERYGRHEDARSCHWMKSALFFRGGRRGGGRIRLPEFYRISNADHFPFSENDAHLRAVGALDESVPNFPRVVIPNYLGSNCFEGGSGLYQHCCVDECDALLGQIESNVQGSAATPAELAAIVAVLPSATISAPRQLPDMLLGQLAVIADVHGGRVPIHGRLFAQWLHSAFPNECPYQHAAGAAAERQESASADSEAIDREPETRETIRQLLATGFQVASPGPATARGSQAAAKRAVARSEPEADAVASFGALPWSEADVNFVEGAGASAPRLARWLMVVVFLAAAALLVVSVSSGLRFSLFAGSSNGKKCRSIDDGPIFSWV